MQINIKKLRHLLLLFEWKERNEQVQVLPQNKITIIFFL